MLAQYLTTHQHTLSSNPSTGTTFGFLTAYTALGLFISHIEKNLSLREEQQAQQLQARRDRNAKEHLAREAQKKRNEERVKKMEELVERIKKACDGAGSEMPKTKVVKRYNPNAAWDSDELCEEVEVDPVQLLADGLVLEREYETRRRVSPLVEGWTVENLDEEDNGEQLEDQDDDKVFDWGAVELEETEASGAAQVENQCADEPSNWDVVEQGNDVEPPNDQQQDEALELRDVCQEETKEGEALSQAVNQQEEEPLESATDEPDESPNNDNDCMAG